MASLRVWNLTPEPITIIGVEQFNDLNTLQSKPNGHFFSSKRTNAASSLDKPEEQVLSPRYQELGVILRPFESYLLSPLVSNDALHASAPTPSLCLTIHDALGTQYSIHAHPSYTQKSSLPFLSPSRTTYTALFHPSPNPQLTILADHPPTYFSSWLSQLPPELPLSHLSIPGTHNSHTHYRALPSVRCQIVDISTQLAHGIRFLDIRLQPTGRELVLVHGAFPVSLTGPKYFTPILQICYAFLASNPGETIVLSLKREGIGNATDHEFARILEQHYIRPDMEKWYTGTAVPRLGHVRGKIVLLRRFRSENADFGLDATGWPGNVGHAVFPSPAIFSVQDYHNVLAPSGIGEKVGYVKEHLGRAAARREVEGGLIHLNFLSASNFWNKACWPEKIARVVNREVEEWLCRAHHLGDGDDLAMEGRLDGVGSGCSGVRKKGDRDGGTGIVIMDFVGEGGDWDLVKLIVGMNMGVLSRFET